MPCSPYSDKKSVGVGTDLSGGGSAAVQASLCAVFRAMLGREPDAQTRSNITTAFGTSDNPSVQLIVHIWHSPEFHKRLERMGSVIAPDFVHGARVRMIESLLPAASRILDLGGANAPLYEMGYQPEFERYVLVDLPADQRCDQYRDVKNVLPERVSIHYGDMADLSDFPDASFDLVWSGQSIEHISLDSGVRMLREARRVLSHDGQLCLDTPNRLVTRIQMAASGGGFIHPEHQHEYAPDELRGLLEDSGFRVVQAKGLCAMPTVASNRAFDPADFIRGQAISDDLDNAYIQFFRCTKST